MTDSPNRVRTSTKLHRNLSESERQRFGAPNIGQLFKKLNRGLNEIWEDYVATDFFLDEAHRLLKKDVIRSLVIPKLVFRTETDPTSKKVSFGIISRIRRKTNSAHAFQDSVSLFEQFLSEMTFKIYMDFPGKLKGALQKGSVEDDGRREKLLTVILDSSDQYEMIHKIVEEKVRGIFYGKPTDVFETDKLRIGFGKDFKSQNQALISAFGEIAARRNIYVHNERRVDRKYISESQIQGLSLGSLLQIDKSYLKTALLVMKDLGAAAAQRSSTYVYNEPLTGRAKKIQAAAAKHPVV